MLTTFDDAARELVSDALAFAAQAHRTQARKNAVESPYIFHPTQVMFLLWEFGVTDPVVLAAAVLHDTLEDTDTSRSELEARFGHEVAAVVAEVSDDKSLPKSERKRLQIAQTANKSQRAKLVKLADKVMNLQDMLASPPPAWSELRQRQYVGWAQLVVDELRGTHSELEERFEAMSCGADAAPWPTDGTEATE